jgi:hypothetical protein
LANITITASGISNNKKSRCKALRHKAQRNYERLRRVYSYDALCAVMSDFAAFEVTKKRKSRCLRTDFFQYKSRISFWRRDFEDSFSFVAPTGVDDYVEGAKTEK